MDFTIITPPLATLKEKFEAKLAEYEQQNQGLDERIKLSIRQKKTVRFIKSKDFDETVLNDLPASSASNGMFNSETTPKRAAIFNSKTEISTVEDITPKDLISTNANELATNTSSVIKDIARRRRTLLDVIVTKIVQYITVSRTTPKPTIADLHSVYLKSKRLRNLIKKKMIKYKRRKIKNQKIDEKLGKKRGVPKKIMTTTKRVPMRKSKYYIRKYVRKNLYRMTTTTPKPTRDPWIYWTKKKEAKKKSKIKRLIEFYKQKQNRAL